MHLTRDELNEDVGQQGHYIEHDNEHDKKVLLARREESSAFAAEIVAMAEKTAG